MKKETLAIWQKGEYQYPLAFGFVPKLVSYIHEEGEQARPCMLVVPGGAYCVGFSHGGRNCGDGVL